jgi:hypothetical protein
MVNSVGSEFYLQLSNKPPIVRTSRCIIWLIGMVAAIGAHSAAAGESKLPCDTTLTANVVAIDHPMVFNRLGAQNVNWMMYALRRDLVHNDQSNPTTFRKPVKPGDNLQPGKVTLRPDLRPRPLVLRVAAGQCLQVTLENLLTPPGTNGSATGANPYDARNVVLLPKPVACSADDLKRNPTKCSEHPMEARSHAPGGTIPDDLGSPSTDFSYAWQVNSDDQVASRCVGFHPQGLELLDSINSDSSYVGKNDNSLARYRPDAVGGGKNGNVCVSRDRKPQKRTYTFLAPHEGAFLVSNDGAVFGSEGTAGNSGLGLFGMVAVEPVGARFYRSQVTEEELRLAAKGNQPTPLGQPIVDYEKKYPDSEPWISEGKAGRPILAMVQNNEIVHSDINAIIAGPDPDGSWKSQCPGPASKCPYPLEQKNQRNPTLPNRLEPFREFASIFHDENAAAQAFPSYFSHPVLSHTLHGVRDAFMINYGSGGVGAEIIANRLGVGPMHDCVDCAYEEFFLASSAVGDPAMIVDKPANLGLENLPPLKPKEKLPAEFREFVGAKATEAFYPHDPANVHHSYLGDFVKFRNVHTGKEQHIFHLHNHQWLFNPNDDNSNYIDAQGIGPGSGYTYEIAFGGSGNRNKSAGDAIFHCHLYPHFAQGMWYLWRIHDVYEEGTRLAVSGPDREGFHQAPFELKSGKPAQHVRALPDGEIARGVPIPALVPLPGKALPPMPGAVEVVARTDKDGKEIGSVAKFNEPPVAGPDGKVSDDAIKAANNPGYPFWIAGIDKTVGSRPTTPPLDMYSPESALRRWQDDHDGSGLEGWNGGLPRHALMGLSQGSDVDHDHTMFTRLSAAKRIELAHPYYFPEEGTPMERVAMHFHGQRQHASWKQDMSGHSDPANFLTNGARDQIASAPEVAGPQREEKIKLALSGSPYHNPCIDDDGHLLRNNGKFFSPSNADDGQSNNFVTMDGKSKFGTFTPRVYKGANIQLDVVFNKVGYHYPQQRILTLWRDVEASLDKSSPKPPEPFVMRMNSFDCAKYLHTNLIPEKFEGDDYQITTPTDVIGQHIHLPKWDLSSADGSANGWNYEDATLSPGTVRERIAAINNFIEKRKSEGDPVEPQKDVPVNYPLKPLAHYYFGQLDQVQDDDCEKLWASTTPKDFEEKYAYPGKCDWLGARTTIQRWFSDPVYNTDKIHRGLGTTFTHDHLGPSTHQQVGLYATMLSEPPGSKWLQNETGEVLGTRDDGGPTSWQAVITKDGGLEFDGDPKTEDSHREFFLQFGDFQHAYVKEYKGVDDKGRPIALTTDGVNPTADGKNSFRRTINPSVRKPATNPTDIVSFPDSCPGPEGQFVSRPCPEAISADDVGMMVVNYRNEPVALRIFDPDTKGQAQGRRGDLAFALQTRTDRQLKSLNTELGDTPYEPLTRGVLPGDAFTPMLRAYSGDRVRVKIQAGSHEHEHNAAINGTRWLQGGSGYGRSPNSGWRGAQNAGLSEQFTFDTSLLDYETLLGYPATDRLYTIDSSQDGMWSGVWGVIRNYNRKIDNEDQGLTPLPGRDKPVVLAQSGGDDGRIALNECPSDAPVRSYSIAAVLANNALKNEVGATLPIDRRIDQGQKCIGVQPSGSAHKNVGTQTGCESNLDPSGGTLVFNNRANKVVLEIVAENGHRTGIQEFGPGPLHDPTAIMFVRTEDLDDQHKLKPGRPVEPLVLRANAGECVEIRLENRLQRNMPDLEGNLSLMPIISQGEQSGEMTTFNNNHIRPSSQIGLHPQLVSYDVQSYDGNNVGVNKRSTVGAGWGKWYRWYAGKIKNESVCTDPKYVSKNDGNEFRRISSAAPLTEFRLENTQSSLADREGRARATVKALFKRQMQSYLRKQAQAELPQGTDEVADSISDEIVTSAASCIAHITQRGGDRLKALRSAAACEGEIKESLRDKLPSRLQALERTKKETLRNVYDALRTGEQASFGLKFRRVLPTAVSSDVLAALEQPVLQGWSDDISGKTDTEDDDDIENFEADGQKLLIKTALASLLKRPNDDQVSYARLKKGTGCELVGVEYGGSNLSPPDRIKQGQKGAVGALVVLPESSRWNEDTDDTIVDHQKPFDNSPKPARRMTRTTASVTNEVAPGANFRDLVAIHQKALNLRYQNGSPIANLAAEARPGAMDPLKTAPEDSHDAGQMALNYGTEPMWYRFAIAPDSIFGNGGTQSAPPVGLGGVSNAWQAFSNKCCDKDPHRTFNDKNGQPIRPTPSVGDPVTAVFQVPRGVEARLRVLEPTGVGRGSTFDLHGHMWRRDPYLRDKGIDSAKIGDNPYAFWLGGQESVTPQAHFDIVLDSSGGRFAVPGDYLFRDHAGFGITSGMWGILRVCVPPEDAHAGVPNAMLCKSMDDHAAQ